MDLINKRLCKNVVADRNTFYFILTAAKCNKMILNIYILDSIRARAFLREGWDWVQKAALYRVFRGDEKKPRIHE